MTKIRLIVSQLYEGYEMDIPQYLNKYSTFELYELIRITDYDGLLSLMKGTKYYDILLKYLDDGLYTFICGPKTWAIVGFDFDKAKEIALGIINTRDAKVEKSIFNDKEINVKFSDGIELIWVPLQFGAFHGMRIGKMWCDKNLNEAQRATILPCFYSDNIKNIIWVE